MIDDARLKALKLVGDTKKDVTEALRVADNPEEAAPLEELRDYLEQIENDLEVTELDEHRVELEAYQHRLQSLDAELAHDPKLKGIARKGEHAAKAIGFVIELAEKVVPPVTHTIPK
jgi:hypothetical protein